MQPNAPGSQGYNLYAYVANNPTTWTDPSGYATTGNAAGAAGTAAAVSIFSLLLFTSLAAACFAFIGCGPFLVAGALLSSTGGLLVLTGLLIAVFAEVACSLNAACYAATQQIGQTIKAYGSAAVAGAWSGGPGDARNAIGALPVIPVVQSVINEYRYLTERNNQKGQNSNGGAGNQQATSPRPGLSFPASELPTSGQRRYVPKQQKGNPEVVPYPGGGYEDVDGNIWEWAKDQHGGPHWDVQHPKTGEHTNVDSQGKVVGKDNSQTTKMRRGTEGCKN